MQDYCRYGLAASGPKQSPPADQKAGLNSLAWEFLVKCATFDTVDKTVGVDKLRLSLSLVSTSAATQRRVVQVLGVGVYHHIPGSEVFQLDDWSRTQLCDVVCMV